MRSKLKLRCAIALLIPALIISSLPGFAFPQENNEEGTVISTATARPAKHAARKTKVATKVAKKPKPDDKQITNAIKDINFAITDLNYKIEYLKARNKSLSDDIEKLEGENRDLGRSLNDRISTLSIPDVSRIDNLETQSALMRAELAQIRADIADIKARLDSHAPKTEQKQEQDQTR